MSNENRTPNMSGDDLVRGLTKTSIAIAPVGAIFKESTSSLANKIVDMMVNTFGIVETDHVFTYPLQDKTGRIYDFDMIMYFNTKCGGENWTIRKQSNGKRVQNMGGGKVNLMGLAGARMSNGGFVLNENFKKYVAPIVDLDDNRNIPIKADPNFPNVATVQCNFFKVVELCLGISPNDNYDFSIIDCAPFKNTNDNMDYNLTITKEISIENSRRGKNGIDYSYSDRRNMRNRR